jgi:HEAT repeat protein
MVTTVSKQDSRLYRSALRRIKAAKDRKKRQALVETTASTKDSWASDVLVDSLDDTNEEIRNLIIRELAKRDDLELERVAEKLAHPLWYVKCAALKILGQKGGQSVLIHIEALLAESNVEVRRAAASALGDIGGKKSLALLLKLSRDRNKFVRTSAEEAIQKVSRIRFT